MSQSVYVMAVSGQSPAVVLELLWWLCKKERAYIAGIEVWTTQKAQEPLRKLLSEAWDTFTQLTGNLPPPQTDAAPAAHAGFRIHVFSDERGPLPDVRDSREAAVVNASLHDRVRTLRAELDPSIRLVGSLAGGRKVVSAALQTAFSLQARDGDRLVHVLLDPTLDDWLFDNRRMSEFQFPDAQWADLSGVPVDEQLTVYDIPFPRLRQLDLEHLNTTLDGHTWTDVWQALHVNGGRDVHATLERTGDTWRYAIRDAAGMVHHETALTGRLGCALAAVIRCPTDHAVRDLVDWLDSESEMWTPPGKDPSDREASVRKAVSSLRKQLESLPYGFKEFALPPHGYRIDADVRVSDAAIAGVPE